MSVSDAQTTHVEARPKWLGRLAPHALIISVVVLIVYILGKDLNWDQYNYHLYLPHAFIHDRLSADWLAASTNTYLNPLPYLPFYWMATANWHSFSIAAVLGAFHALNICIIWSLSHRHLFRDSAHRIRYAVIATMLAAMTPVYIALIGASFLEASLSVFSLLALLLACEAIAFRTDSPRMSMLLASGGVLGASMGFKLTGIVFAVSLLVALAIVLPRRHWIRSLTMLCMGIGAGYVLTNGWLAWRLWTEFGNPVFPFFNGQFQSGDFLPVNLSHDRFRWNSISELLLLPFSMTIPLSWVYVEPKVPDIRPAALVLAAVALVVQATYHRLKGKPGSRADGPSAIVNQSAGMATRLMIAFFITSIPFWLVTSGNARYGLPIMLLCGPVLVVGVTQGVRSAKVATYILLTLAGWQGIQQAFAGSPRWDMADWTPTWYSTEIPARLKNAPFAYVSLGETHSNSFVAPFLHRESTFTSLTGNTFTVSPDLPSSRRHKAFLERHGSQLRTLFAVRNTANYVTNLDRRHLDDSLAPWLLRVDYEDCEYFRINLENPGANSDLYDGPGPIDLRDRLNNKYDTRLVSCRIVPGPGESDAVRAERARITRVFDRVEESCPMLFSPRGWLLSRTVSGWKRHYLRSDILMGETRGKISLRRDLFGPFDVPVGTVQQWERGEVPFKCERLEKHWQKSLDD